MTSPIARPNNQKFSKSTKVRTLKKWKASKKKKKTQKTEEKKTFKSIYSNKFISSMYFQNNYFFSSDVNAQFFFSNSFSIRDLLGD